MKREFRSRAAWPVFQFIGAVLVIAFVIFIFGFLQPSDATANGPVGFGLVGAPGRSCSWSSSARRSAGRSSPTS